MAALFPQVVVPDRRVNACRKCVPHIPDATYLGTLAETQL